MQAYKTSTDYNREDTQIMHKTELCDSFKAENAQNSSYYLHLLEIVYHLKKFL